jgi:hypothetical protein
MFEWLKFIDLAEIEWFYCTKFYVNPLTPPIKILKVDQRFCSVIILQRVGKQQVLTHTQKQT